MHLSLNAALLHHPNYTSAHLRLNSPSIYELTSPIPNKKQKQKQKPINRHIKAAQDLVIYTPYSNASRKL